ncbi:MAG: replicative DNA helicase, partial [Pseudomonadales bacterium]|nr:replicative DNA helicase [Pseudomonadales bacterium]
MPEQEPAQSSTFNLASGIPKVPPHSVEAEQGVLGGILLANESFDAVSEVLQANDFYLGAHRTIFNALTTLNENEQPFDFITLTGQLKHEGELENAGGISYLTDLIENTPSSSNVLSYARIVKERAIFRQLIQLGSDVTSQSYNPLGKESDELLAQAEQKLLEIAEARPKEGGFRHVAELTKAIVDRLDELGNSDSPITGLTTGFTRLDTLTSGWQKGDLVIIAARPSMGKTAFAMNAVENALLNSDQPILVFSLEMPAESILMRMMSSL